MKRAFLFALIITSIFSCKKQEVEPESQETPIVIETYDAESADSIDIAEESENNGRYWSSEETNLPVGVVIASDHSHNKTNLNENYVTIKQTNQFLTIRRDIDVDLYLNLHQGDSIK